MNLLVYFSDIIGKCVVNWKALSCWFQLRVREIIISITYGIREQGRISWTRKANYTRFQFVKLRASKWSVSETNIYLSFKIFYSHTYTQTHIAFVCMMTYDGAYDDTVFTTPHIFALLLFKKYLIKKNNNLRNFHIQNMK